MMQADVRPEATSAIASAVRELRRPLEPYLVLKRCIYMRTCLPSTVNTHI